MSKGYPTILVLQLDSALEVLWIMYTLKIQKFTFHGK